MKWWGKDTTQAVDDRLVGDLMDTRLSFFPEPGG